MADHPSTPKLLSSKASNVSARNAMTFAFVFMLAFIPCTLFILFYPSTHSSSSSPPSFLRNIVNFKHPSFLSSNGSSLSSIFPHLFPNSSTSDSNSNTHLPTSHNSLSKSGNNASNLTRVVSPLMANNSNSSATDYTNQDTNGKGFAKSGTVPKLKQSHSPTVESSSKNVSSISATQNSGTSKGLPSQSRTARVRGNDKVRKRKEQGNVRVRNRKKQGNELYESMLHCNIFDGKWVKDDSYPLYAPGSCPHIDEPFNCFLNGRPENGYEKYRWQPHRCNIPRLNGTHMLELLRGKRLVFVGDSLNRNMWESLVCILRNSVEDKRRVFEASGRIEFRTESSYSFIFTDYNCSVEFFSSPFLVQEWEVSDKNGSKKETLRLDLVERSSDRYKDAEVLIFNTGHWWTHEKTTKGQGYYQEGSYVYDELDTLEAFRRAMTTWARWVDANVNPSKTQVFFRGYSSSHFGGGKWNSGGRCDKETEPFKNDSYLESYPPKMQILENVMKWMKTPVFYLNITRLSDYRKDAHPSIYRAQHLTEEERHSPLRYQDCSHWCLPGVPDTWNEFVYSQILVRHYQKQLQDQQHQEGRSKRT